ncbi:MAG TPA: AMP-binding protein, partial [Solirubrobacteraceae bacterium]|nr:AMP-binding protein [Solirubrobacteraceae bacterium]
MVIGGDRCPIVDTWWQTETGHIMISPLPAITDTKPGSATRPRPGIGAAVLDESSGEDAGTEQGLLVVRRPWPGMLRTLYRTRTASSKPTGTSSASTPTRSARRPAATRTAISGSS